MFSSVFEKVVSTTAPGALATFPQPAALPVPASTLCCLSFADWFLKNYPVLATQEIDEDCNFTNLRLLGRAGVSGVAVSAHELDSVMQNAAKLGCRLAPALAGTSWSRPNETKMVSVSELLAKVRGIFGNRLTSVGRDIRVMRDAQAEKDENLLLRQIYTLKNAALETCNGQKWCIVVSSGGESLIVCSVPLPPTEVDRNTGCDFLVFDPWPRPTLKLQGSYIVKFTTVRGLQLHLLSVLGEIWRERDRVDQVTIKDGFVLLSVVMGTERTDQENNFNTEERGLLRESVTRLRKAEKAAAIRIKREEVKALRRALEDSKQKHAISPEPMAEEDNGSEKQEGAHSDLLSVSASSYSMGRSECIHLTPERNAGTRFTKSEEASAEQVTRAGIPTSTMEPARTMKASLSGQIEVKHVQGGGKYLGNPGDRYKFTDLPQQRPPFAGNCPPLTARRLTIEKRQTGENWEGYGERGRDLGPSAEPKASHSETLGIKGGNVEGVMETLDNPFNRALLRSLEGEALEDYSKRAYKVCRTNGIIHHNALDLDPTSAPWRASSLVQPCRFGSANSIPGVSTIRGIERESQDIQKGETSSFREDSQRHGMVESGLDTISLVDNAAENCPISNDYAPVVDDMSASEEALPHPVLRPPSEKMRPRLETARAGRALASASSNTREGSARSRKELNGPQLDLSGNPLPLPPHVLKPSDCVWKDDGPLRSTSGPSCNGKHEGERFGGVTGNPDLVAEGNVADGRVVLLSPRESCSPHSNKLERGRLAWSPVGGTGRRGDDDPLTVEPTLQREDSSPVDSKKDVCSAREHKDRNVGEYGIAELGDDKRKAEKVTDRFARSTTPPRVIHSRQMAIKPGMAAPVALSNDIEHLTPSREDDDAFVWFGEPDSPTCHRSTENVEVAADTRGRGQTCHLQHQRNKAKLILAMDVRRQRSIIECALRARERVWRMRRSNLGAEVLMKFYALRRNGEIKKLSQEHQPFSDADQQGNGRAKEINVPEITALRSNRRGARNPEKSPIRVEAKAVPGIKDTTERTEARRPGDEPEPDTVAGESFVSREDHRGISVTRVSAPLPVSFEVMADGITGLGAGGGGKQEQARRQKRLEALRARKEAEAKERKRIQKERRAAEKQEEHQKATRDTYSQQCVKHPNGQTNQQALDHDRGTPDRHGTSLNRRHAHARGPSLSEEAASSRVRDTPQEGGKIKSRGTWCDSMATLVKDGSPAVRGLSRRSNRQLVRNAIKFLCLAGGHVQEKKGRVLQALDSHQGLNYVLLLSHNNLLTFKGLYACSGGGEGGEIAERLCGLGPPQINVGMVSGFYKYNSAAREFREVHSKTLGKTTDAVSVEPTKFRRSNGQCNLL